MKNQLLKGFFIMEINGCNPHMYHIILLIQQWGIVLQYDKLTFHDMYHVYY